MMKRRRGREDLFDRVAPNCGSGVIVMMVGLIAALAGWQQRSALALAFGGSLMILPTATWIVLGRIVARISISQSLTERVFEGDQVEVHVTMEGPLPPPGFDLRLSERLGLARGYIRTMTFGEVDDEFGGRERRYRLRCELPRGIYEAGEAYLRLGDPFGWFEVRRPMRTKNRVLVLPRILPLSSAILRAIGSARIGSGLSVSASGRSAEFRGHRPYRPGDPRSRVHWKQTARSGRLIMREDEQEHEGGLILVLDRDLADDARGVGRGTLDCAARLVASLVVAARRQGLRIGFVHGPEAEERLDVAGEGDVIVVLERLAVLRLAEVEVLSATLDSLKDCLQLPSRLLVISTAASLRRTDLVGRARRLRRKGHELGLLLFADGDDETLDPVITPDIEVTRVDRRTFAGANP